MAETYGVADCVAVNSGLAMVTITLMALTKAGGTCPDTDSVYDPTRRFCDSMLKRFGVVTTYYDPLIGPAIAGLIRPETCLVFTESPGSLTFEVQDIPGITASAHSHGVKVVIDKYRPRRCASTRSITASMSSSTPQRNMLPGTQTCCSVPF